VVERTVEVDTGESLAFSYELAGLGSRFLALFIDGCIQVLSVIGIALVIFFASIQKISGSIFLGLVIITFFLLFFGYFVIFEWLWNGCTPGKRLMGIRVVRDGGFPLDFLGSAIRNLVRVLEFGLGLYCVSAISALLSKQNKRLGDFAAGTIVVRDMRYERAQVKAYERESEDPVVRELGFRERDLIRKFIARRDALDPRARQALAADIASRIRPRLGANFGYLNDDDLLMHLARTAL
jgi:uncharacterized RDD family membrane protein YckC